MALTPAEKQKRYRERKLKKQHTVRLVKPGESHASRATPAAEMRARGVEILLNLAAVSTDERTLVKVGTALLQASIAEQRIAALSRPADASDQLTELADDEVVDLKSMVEALRAAKRSA